MITRNFHAPATVVHCKPSRIVKRRTRTQIDTAYWVAMARDRLDLLGTFAIAATHIGNSFAVVR